MDNVFVVPPKPFYAGRKRDLEVNLDTSWYSLVLLLFRIKVLILSRIKVKSDSGQIWECDCAMIDVLLDLEPARHSVSPSYE